MLRGNMKGLLGRAAGRIAETYKYYSDRRFTTLAGTLVYFFLMSLAPFLFWLTMFFGNVDLGRIGQIPLFAAVLPLLEELKSAAGGAAEGAGIVFIVTTLYSSTNFFYHLRRSGEIIYGGRYKKGGIKLRIHSLVLIVSAAVSLAVAFGVLALGERLLGMVLNRAVSVFIVCMAAAGAATLGACVLNAFVCPYGVKLGDVLTGSLLTVVLWLVCGAGFAVYLRYADPVRLYGRIASVIVFLLWCYLMMNCFVIGVIYNGRHCVTPKHSLA